MAGLVTIDATSVSYNGPGSGVHVVVPPGDTLQLSFAVSNEDTATTMRMTSVGLELEALTGGTGFSSLAAADLQRVSIHNSNGTLVGMAPSTGAGAYTITCNLGGDTSIAPSTSKTFYITIATSPSADQTIFKVRLNGVLTTPTLTDIHNLLSTTLQIFKPHTVATSGAGRTGAVVGAGAGPFGLFTWVMDNRTEGTVRYRGATITCTNVRGFVPGALSKTLFDPLQYTGDLEKITLSVNNAEVRSATRKGRLRSAGYGVAAPFYTMFLPANVSGDDEDAGTDIDVAASTSSDFGFSFYTNAYMSDLPAPGGVVPGDAWYATIDTFRIECLPAGSSFLKNTDPDFSISQKRTAVIYEVLGPLFPYSVIAHPQLDANSTAYNDQADLDYITFRPVFPLTIVGGPGNTQGLRSIRLNLNYGGIEDFNSETSPLRRIDQTDYSGFQIRSTTDRTYSNSDRLYPLDVSQTLITRSANQTTVDLVIAGFLPLATDSAIYFTAGGWHPTVWLGVEPSVNSQFADTLTLEIPSGGFGFLSGLVSYESHAMSRLSATDTTGAASLKLPDLTADLVYPLNDTAHVIFGTNVIWRDLTAAGQSVPAPSQPTAVTGMSVWDGGFNSRISELVFFVMDAVASGGEAIHEVDFNLLANNETSGWAVYRDNDAHPNNNNGVFDPGIDSFVSLVLAGTRYVPIGNQYSSDLLSGYGAANQPLMIRLQFDPTQAAVAVPRDDVGTNGGDDFFLVLRTSATMTPVDKFRVVVGDINSTIINTYNGGVTFETTTASVVSSDRVYSRGTITRLLPEARAYSGNASSNTVRSEVISISGGIAVNVTNLIVGSKNVFRGLELPVFGMNAIDTGGGISVVSLLVDVIDSGVTGNFDTRSDLAAFLSNRITKNYGLVVFQDNGTTTGSFDAGDSVIPGNWSVIAGPDSATTRFQFVFSPAWDIPDTDVGAFAGNDIFVVVQTSDSLLFQDDFSLRIPANAFTFAPPGVISQPPPVSTSLLTGGMPTRIVNVDTSHDLPNNGRRTALFGVMAADTTWQGGGNIFLDRVRLRLDDPTSPGGFPTAILMPLGVGDSSAGISVWIDGNGNRRFDDDLTMDTCLPATFQWQSANILDIDVLNSAAAVPDTDPYGFLSDTATVYFVVFRASTDGLDHQLQATISSVTEPLDPWIKFTAPTDRSQVFTSSILTIAPAGVTGTFSPSVFSPNGDGVTDTVGVMLTVIPDNGDSRWTLSVTKISSAISQTLGSGAFDSTILIGPATLAGSPPTFAWPSAFVYGGAFNLSFAYDRAGTPKTFAFGDTLIVDLHCTAPVLISALPAVVTSGNTVAVSISADSNRSGLDAFALTAGESAAAYSIFRIDGTVATLLVNGTLSNFRADNISVPLQGGNNVLAAVLRDTYGNRSDTRTLGTVALSVGSNQTIVQDILTDPAKRWLGDRDSVAVFGINVTQDFSGEAITAFTIQIFDSGGFALGQNIQEVPTTVAYPETAGILIFKDHPTLGTKGSWDTQDVLVPMNPPQRNASFVSGDTIRFIPQAPMTVPANDTEAANQGFDFFIVVHGAGGRYFRDSFVLSMPANTAFEFATASPTRSNLSNRVTSTPIVTRIPRKFLDRTTANDSFTIGTNYQEIFGLNINDSTRTGDGGASLTSIALDFTIAAGDTFNPAILSYQVYRDSGSANIGSFDRATDSEVTTIPTILSPTRVLLTLLGANAAIPGHDVGQDSGPDFWIAIRPSVISLSLSNRFTVAILPGNAVTTGDSPGGPGITGSKQVSVPAGGLSTAITPNPFSPNGDGKFDTAGYAISFADTRGFRVVVLRATTGDTLYNIRGYAKDTTVVFAYADSTTGWTTDEYRILVTDTVTGATSTEATLLVADIQALTPTFATTPASSTSGTSLTLTVRVSELTENSAQRARSKSERDSFSLTFTISSTTSGDTVDTAFGALTSSSVDVSKTITIFEGANTVRVTLTDKVGNIDSSLVFNIASGATITGNIGFEGNAPVFRYSPSNPNFTFTFPTTVTGGTLEFYNITGERVRLINLIPGVTQVDWNGANDAAQTLRNGVYVIKFKVPLSDGRTIEEARTIFLLK